MKPEQYRVPYHDLMMMDACDAPPGVRVGDLFRDDSETAATYKCVKIDPRLGEVYFMRQWMITDAMLHEWIA